MSRKTKPKDSKKQIAIIAIGFLILLILALVITLIASGNDSSDKNTTTTTTKVIETTDEDGNTTTVAEGQITGTINDYSEIDVRYNTGSLTKEETKEISTAANNAKAISINCEEVQIAEEVYDLSSDPDENGMPQVVTDYTWGLEFTISNLPKGYSINITNDTDKESVTYTSDNKNKGTVTYQTTKVLNEANYYMTVYYTTSSGSKQAVRKLAIETPQYNTMSDMQMCQNVETAECARFLTEDDSEKTLDERIDEVSETKEENSNKKKKQQANVILYVILVALSLVLLAMLITLYTMSGGKR